MSCGSEQLRPDKGALSHLESFEKTNTVTEEEEEEEGTLQQAMDFQNWNIKILLL